MKTILSALIILLAFAFTMPAQTLTDNFDDTRFNEDVYMLYKNLPLDSAETAYSPDFSLSLHDDYSYYTYPFSYFYDAETADSINISVYWIVNYLHPDSLSHWVVADTIATLTTATADKGTFNLNNVKAPYNKLKVQNNTGSKSNYLDLGIFQGK